jgi:hypothetical protein
MEEIDEYTFLNIAIYMDDKTLTRLLSMIVTSEIIRNTIKKNTFWYERCQILLKRKLIFRNINWVLSYRQLVAVINEIYPIEHVIILYKDKGVDTINILMEIGFDPSVNNNTAIVEAVYFKAIESIILLLNDSRVDPSIKDNFIIETVAKGNYNPLLMKLLLENPKIDPTINHNRAIFLAVKHGSVEVVKLLLEDPRVDPTIDNNYLIKYAVNVGEIDKVKLLLTYPKVNPGATNNYAILRAVDNGNIEIIKLLSADPRVDASASNNLAIKTAADKSIKYKKYDEIIRILLEHPRVDPSIDNNYVVKKIISEPENSLLFDLLLSNSKITINRDLILNSPPYYYSKDYIYNYITNSLNGVIAMHKIHQPRHYSLNTILYYSEKKINNIKDLYHQFLQSIIFKRLSLLDRIKKLTNLLSDLEGMSILIINNAVKSILQPSDSIKNLENNDYIYAFRGFLLLCYKPEYVYSEIIQLLTTEGASKHAIYLASKLIGAQIGLNKLIIDGLYISPQLMKYINNMSSWRFIENLVY